MEDKIRNLINRLKEHADWAEGNIWEVPITLPDDINEAIAYLEILNKMPSQFS